MVPYSFGDLRWKVTVPPVTVLQFLGPDSPRYISNKKTEEEKALNASASSLLVR